MRKERNKDLKNNIKDLCNLDKKDSSRPTSNQFFKKQLLSELNQAVIDMKDKAKKPPTNFLFARAKGFNDPKEEIRDGRCDDVEKISDNENKNELKEGDLSNTNKEVNLAIQLKKVNHHLSLLKLSLSKLQA